jgi:chromosome segregation ATPase
MLSFNTTKAQDLATILAILGSLITGIVYIVSLSNAVDEIKRTKAPLAEIHTVIKELEKLEGMKADADKVSKLDGRLEALEKDKDYSSILKAKNTAISEFRAAVANARAELSKIEEEKINAIELIHAEVGKAEKVKGDMTIIVDSKIEKQVQLLEEIKIYYNGEIKKLSALVDAAQKAAKTGIDNAEVAQRKISSLESRLSGLKLTFVRPSNIYDIAKRGQEKDCPVNTFAYGFRNAQTFNQALDMWRCGSVELHVPSK